MTAIQFHPVFRTDVFIVCPAGLAAQYPNGAKWQMPQSLCLSDASATELAEVLHDLHLAIVHPYPLGTWWRFYPSSPVAHFLFPDGTLINAADLAMWWKRMDPVNAERTARLEASVAQKEHAEAQAQEQQQEV
jgi:hypothetical protein